MTVTCLQAQQPQLLAAVQFLRTSLRIITLSITELQSPAFQGIQKCPTVLTCQRSNNVVITMFKVIRTTLLQCKPSLSCLVELFHQCCCHPSLLQKIDPSTSAKGAVSSLHVLDILVLIGIFSGMKMQRIQTHLAAANAENCCILISY